MAKITISARPLGVDGVLRRFLVAAARLPNDTRDAQRELGKLAEVVFGAFVPVKTGRELRGIGSDMAGGVVTVTDFARNPESGYDYVGVTRFGHRVARIFAKHSAGAYSLATGKQRRGALRFSIGGQVLYRASVRGYHPASDWVQDAMPEVETQAEVVATRLGRTVEAHF